MRDVGWFVACYLVGMPIVSIAIGWFCVYHLDLYIALGLAVFALAAVLNWMDRRKAAKG